VDKELRNEKEQNHFVYYWPLKYQRLTSKPVEWVGLVHSHGNQTGTISGFCFSQAGLNHHS
jgi:hypothetical protein